MYAAPSHLQSDLGAVQVSFCYVMDALHDDSYLAASYEVAVHTSFYMRDILHCRFCSLCP